MIILGYCALIRLARFPDIIDTRFGAASVLGRRETDLWARCVTRKRKIEFLGGRIAGKLAANTCRITTGAIAKPWNAIEIYPQENGSPTCDYGDGLGHPISISHSNNWALALVSLDKRMVAADIEDHDSRVWPVADMFHELEISQIRSLQDARLRWTLKEVWGKLTTKGIQGYTRELITLSLAGRLWLVIPARMSSTESSILAGGTFGLLTVTIGCAPAAGRKVGE